MDFLYTFQTLSDAADDGHGQILYILDAIFPIAGYFLKPYTAQKAYGSVVKFSTIYAVDFSLNSMK